MSSALGISSPGLRLSNTYAILIATHDDDPEWQISLTLVGRFIIYVTILLLFFMIGALIVKFLGGCDGGDAEETFTATERNRLLVKGAIPFTYGACEADAESGKCISSSSSEDLYDGKICVICYDEQRNCFFIPCGHCATCYDCAQRIKEEESKTCPVCRRYVGKVRRLSVS